MTMDVNGLQRVECKSRSALHPTRDVADAVQDSAHSITKLLQRFDLLLDGADTLA